MMSAKVTVTATHKSNATLSYVFGGSEQKSNEMTFTPSSARGAVSLSVKGSDDTKIDLEPLDFAWNSGKVNQKFFPHGDYRNGQKGAIVEMFGWPHKDVERECEFLAKSGYMGVSFTLPCPKPNPPRSHFSFLLLAKNSNVFPLLASLA